MSATDCRAESGCVRAGLARGEQGVSAAGRAFSGAGLQTEAVSSSMSEGVC